MARLPENTPSPKVVTESGKLIDASTPPSAKACSPTSTSWLGCSSVSSNVRVLDSPVIVTDDPLSW